MMERRTVIRLLAILGLVLLAVLALAGVAAAVPLSFDGSNGGFGPKAGDPCASWQYLWVSYNGYGERFVCWFYTGGSGLWGYHWKPF